MKEIHRARYGARTESIRAPAEGHSASIMHQLEDLQTLDFGAFMEASLHRHD